MNNRIFIDRFVKNNKVLFKEFKNKIKLLCKYQQYNWETKIKKIEKLNF